MFDCYNSLELHISDDGVRKQCKESMDNNTFFKFLITLCDPTDTYKMTEPKDLDYTEDGDCYLHITFEWGGVPDNLYESLMELDESIFHSAVYHQYNEGVGEYMNDCGTLIEAHYDIDRPIPYYVAAELGLIDNPMFTVSADGEYVTQIKDDTNDNEN
jgi:hypothetical protein